MTKVVFRKYKDNGKILAVFPELPWLGFYAGDSVTCYEHVGQHGGGSLKVLRNITAPCAGTEHLQLLEELSLIGYDDLVIENVL